MERDVCIAVEELNMRTRELAAVPYPRSHTPHLPLQVEELVALAATAGRLPAHTFAEAVKAAYDCCAAPLKVLRAGGTAAANASVIDVAADASELTADASELEAETCAMMVAEVCVVRDVWSVLRRPTHE